MLETFGVTSKIALTSIMKAFQSTSKGLFSEVYLEDITLILTKLKVSKGAGINNIYYIKCSEIPSIQLH